MREGAVVRNPKDKSRQFLRDQQKRGPWIIVVPWFDDDLRQMMLILRR